MNHTQTPSTAPADRAHLARREDSQIGALPGAPLRPRSCLDQGTRSPTTMPEMEALRQRVWRDQGVVSLALDDVTDPWLRQAIQNEAVRRWGPRRGDTHGR